MTEKDSGGGAAFGPANIDPDVLFQAGFGAFGVKDKTPYSDPRGNFHGAGLEVDLRDNILEIMERNIQQKAFDTQAGGAGTAGYAMIPIYVDPNIVDRTRKFTPLVEIFPKVANLGTTADFNVITAKGSSEFLLEDSSLDEQDDTFDRVSEPIKYAYAVGRVTGPSLAATPPYSVQMYNPSGTGLAGSTFASGSAPNAKQLQVLTKSRAMMELLENKLINGDKDTNAEEPDGIIELQSTTNVVDLNSTAMDLTDIDTAIQYAYDDGGRPNLAITDSVTYRELIALLRDSQRTVPTEEIFGIGRIVLDTMIGRVPVIPSQFMTTTDGSRAMYFLDLSVWEQRYLLDVTYQDLARTSDAEKFMLKAYVAFICRAPTFNSWIGEISTA